MIPALPNNVQPVFPPDANDSTFTFPVIAEAAPIAPILQTTLADVAFSVTFPPEEIVPEVGVITLITSKAFPIVRLEPALFKTMELIAFVEELDWFINNELAIVPVPAMLIEDVLEPAIEPFVEEVGKVMLLFRVSNLPFKLRVPAE